MKPEKRRARAKAKRKQRNIERNQPSAARRKLIRVKNGLRGAIGRASAATKPKIRHVSAQERIYRDEKWLEVLDSGQLFVFDWQEHKSKQDEPCDKCGIVARRWYGKYAVPDTDAGHAFEWYKDGERMITMFLCAGCAIETEVHGRDQRTAIIGNRSKRLEELIDGS